MGVSKRATLENCLNFSELKKDLAHAGFVMVPQESNWNVLVVRKTKSAIDFSAEVYNDITKVSSGKAYVAVFMNYRAPPKPLPSLELSHNLAPPLDAILEGVPQVNFDRLIGAKSTRTNKNHVLGYQLGIEVKNHAEEEMRAAVRDTLKYFSAYAEKQAKAVAKQ